MQNDVELNADDLQSLCEAYKDVYEAHEKTFRRDPTRTTDVNHRNGIQIMEQSKSASVS